MPTRRTLLKSAAAAAIAMAALAAVAPASAASGKPLKVVATFSILGDMVSRIGGDRVSVTALVGPDGDTHVYRPTPAAARTVSEADILVFNGLHFEGWLDRLIETTGFSGVRVVATAGIEPLATEGGGHDDHDEHGRDRHHKEGESADRHGDKHDEHDHGDRDRHHKEGESADRHGDKHDHGDRHHGEGMSAERHDDDHDGHDHGAFDPHAWQSLRHATAYIDNIAAALAKADPDNASVFYKNRAAYAAELKALDAEIRGLLAALPKDRRTVVTSHDAFQYFGHDYGLTFVAPQGISTESEASAKDVVRLIGLIRDGGIRAVFVENITDPRLLKQIADETGAAIGGTLYPGALSGPDGPAPTYIDLMRHNARTIAKALAPR